MKSKLKLLRYFLEYLVVKLGILFFSLFKAQKASNIAAKISRFVGKKLAVNKLAYDNLSKAMPELSNQEKEQILDDMWDNLGRIVGEYYHIAKMSADEIERVIELPEETRKTLADLKASKKGGIIFAAHIGNWEVGPKGFIKNGLEVATVYRPLNNPYVEKLTASMRKVELIEKSISGSRKIVQAVKEGKFVIIMADQKVSEGEPVKFFNDLAITTTSIARIALKYDAPLIGARAIRIGKSFKFRAEVEKPLAIERSNDINADILRLTREINLKIESWIRQYPEQWFWVHNRWKK